MKRMWTFTFSNFPAEYLYTGCFFTGHNLSTLILKPLGHIVYISASSWMCVVITRGRIFFVEVKVWQEQISEQRPNEAAVKHALLLWVKFRPFFCSAQMSLPFKYATTPAQMDRWFCGIFYSNYFSLMILFKRLPKKMTMLGKGWGRKKH